MNLHRIANRFDKVVCSDAYNPATTFLAQLDLYDDSKRDGVTVDRRVLSCSPDVTIPARKTILAEGKYWIVGQVNIDSFRGRPIRHRYIMHECEFLGAVHALGGMLDLVPGTPTYVAAVWVKDIKEADTSSKFYSFMNIE
jgi:hypothetical protein